MRNLRRVVALSFVAAIATIAPAGAINSYNSREAPERTEVGAFVALYDRDGDGTIDRFQVVCTGTMVDGNTFLTAAHCTTGWFGEPKFYVSLLQDVKGAIAQLAAAHPKATLSQLADLAVQKKIVVPGVPHWDPKFPGTSADAHDIAVLEVGALPRDWTFTPARLPTAGQLDALGPQVLDTLEWYVVGYGTQEAVNGPGGQTHPGSGVRRIAPLSFDALNATWVRLAQTEPQGNGGACYGDSGGPNFMKLDGRLVLAATTITGDSPCYATNVAYRTDTPSARAFLEDYVALP